MSILQGTDWKSRQLKASENLIEVLPTLGDSPPFGD